MALLLTAGMGGCAKEKPTVFGPVVAGKFYTADRAALEAEIQGYLKAADPVAPETEVLGYIVPHAGYIYSGPVAAYAYDLLRGTDVKVAVIIAPSHYVYSDKVAALDADMYGTPLGEIPVAKDEISKLIRQDESLFTRDVSMFSQEHSLEVQLPFLQETLKSFRIVPLVMGNPRRQTAARLARALDRTFGHDGVIYIASSDMSHHFTYDTATDMDRLALQRILSMDIAGLVNDDARERCQLCGMGPVTTLMELAALEGYSSAHELKYANSGDTAGPKSSVVGYCAVAFSSVSRLAKSDKEELVALARRSIESWMEQGKLPEYVPGSEALRARGAAFVTLKDRGRLRGCIGQDTARMPLYRCVQEMAVAAAFEDPRFPQVRSEELPGLTIEISVMSPLRTVTQPADVTVGRDGLVVRKRGRSGLLLPQVPVEQGWEREQFISQTCVKAGLPPDEWKKGVEMYAFSADVFGEESLR
jgi:AmmeMemoRadiSam system protein B/AmmeMemoRadiSam system protein A